MVETCHFKRDMREVLVLQCPRPERYAQKKKEKKAGQCHTVCKTELRQWCSATGITRLLHQIFAVCTLMVQWNIVLFESQLRSEARFRGRRASFLLSIAFDGPNFHPTALPYIGQYKLMGKVEDTLALYVCCLPEIRHSIGVKCSAVFAGRLIIAASTAWWRVSCGLCVISCLDLQTAPECDTVTYLDPTEPGVEVVLVQRGTTSGFFLLLLLSLFVCFSGSSAHLLCAPDSSLV